MEIRRFRIGDAAAVLALAPRLTTGTAPWRDPQRVLASVSGWVAESIAAAGDSGRAALVAVNGEDVLGFVSVGTKRHWSGDRDAYIGELMVAEHAAGAGVGSALLEAAEHWARERGLRRMQLETGAANEQARAFYAAGGYEPEEVRLSKPLT